MKRVAALFFLILSLLFAETAEEKGLRLNEEADKRHSGFISEVNTTQMVLINAYGDETIRRMTSKIIEVEGDGDRSIFEFLWPADVKGTRLLTWAHRTENDDQWLYLPAIKRVKRISSTNQSGSFMGSEFSYEDISAQEVEKFTYKYLRDESLDGRDTWVIERYPVNKKSGYSKQVVWMDKEYYGPLKIDYYDRKGDLLKTSSFNDYELYGSFWLQNEIKIVNHQTKKQSILTWQSRELGQEISQNEFQKNNLIR